jgi:hypothetical protein
VRIAASIVMLLLLTHSAWGAPFDRWWIEPISNLSVTASVFDEHARSYSTALRPRDLVVGGIALSCEHNEGMPCGNGSLSYGLLESRAGFTRWLELSTRLRAQLGTEIDNTLLVERAHLDLNVDKLGFQIGRDTLRIGPQARTAMSWGDNAPPLDMFRAKTLRAIAIGPAVGVNLDLLAGRLRNPQRYPDALVTIGRIELEVHKSTRIGLVQLLALGGEGAAELSVWDFIAEHLRRKDLSGTETDSSNRRFGGDIETCVQELGTTCLYYALVFEDIRKARFVDAVRYDADHLIGANVRIADTSSVVIEYQQTGVRSQEHIQRTSGFTNGGFLVGSPLGPDAKSIYGAVELNWKLLLLRPWLEAAVLESATYEFVDHGPITPKAEGPNETRLRGGISSRRTLGSGVWLEAQILIEHVNNFAFESGVEQNNGGARLTIGWSPGIRIERKSL